MRIEKDADPVAALSQQVLVIATAIATLQTAIVESRALLSSLSEPAGVTKLAKGRREIGRAAESFHAVNGQAMPLIAAELRSLGVVVSDAARLAHLQPLTRVKEKLT